MDRICPQNEKALIPVIRPDEVSGYLGANGIVLIASSYYQEIMLQLEKLHVPKEQVINGCRLPERDYDKGLEKIMLSNYYTEGNFYEVEGFKILWKDVRRYGREYLMYDSFIPYLGRLEERIAVKRGNSSHWIVDIGANVGDTALRMIKYTSANIMAVEPTEDFFQILKENISKIDAQYADRIHTVQAYISNNEKEKYCSKIANGTAVKQLCERAEAPTISVWNLLKKYDIDPSEVHLIKVDTDGYDADCIMSCKEMLKDYTPLLYWENQIDDEIQYGKYMECCDYLMECGYCHYFIFDNFGNYIGCVDNAALKSINGYLMRIHNFYGTRTFYYVDVLACKQEDKEEAIVMVDDYLKNYPVERYGMISR